jgi:ribosome-binding factor A
LCFTLVTKANSKNISMFLWSSRFLRSSKAATFKKFDRQLLSSEISHIRNLVPQREADFKTHEFSPQSFSPQFESMRKTPLYSDLTHEETKQLKIQRHKNLLVERRKMFLKQLKVDDPERKAKEILKTRRKAENSQTDPSDPSADSAFASLYTPLTTKQERKFTRMESEAEKLALESQLRNKLRREKLASSSVLNAPFPDNNGKIADPIKRQIFMRKTRIQVLFKQYIEEYLHHNHAQITEDVLKGASISIEEIQSENYRKTQIIKVRILSADATEDAAYIKDIENRLNVVAPKIRSQICSRVKLGFVPELKFVVKEEVGGFNKRRLNKLVKADISSQLMSKFSKEMNW